MTAHDLLSQLSEKGVEVKTSGDDRLVIDAPKGTITEALRAERERQRIEVEARERAEEENRRQIAEQELARAEEELKQMRAMEEARRAEVEASMHAAEDAHATEIAALRTIEDEQARHRAEE